MCQYDGVAGGDPGDPGLYSKFFQKLCRQLLCGKEVRRGSRPVQDNGKLAAQFKIRSFQKHFLGIGNQGDPFGEERGTGSGCLYQGKKEKNDKDS